MRYTINETTRQDKQQSRITKTNINYNENALPLFFKTLHKFKTALHETKQN